MAENLAYLPTVSPSSEGSATTAYNYVNGYNGNSEEAKFWSSAPIRTNAWFLGMFYGWEG
jgi:hypothetical protein